MPDSLVSLVSPALSTAPPPSASMPAVPFSATALLVSLYREAQAAADALEGSDEEPDGPLGESYGAATDRFIEAPVNTIGDVLLKLEHIAYHEDLEAKPRLILNRTLLALLRDLRATDAAHRTLSAIEEARRPATLSFASVAEEQPEAAAFDSLAVHAAADKEVDEIYRRQGQIDGALVVLREVAGRICGDSFEDEKKVLFLLDVMTEAADGILYANDRLTNALNPLNPTILDDGSSL